LNRGFDKRITAFGCLPNHSVFLLKRRLISAWTETILQMWVIAVGVSLGEARIASACRSICNQTTNGSMDCQSRIAGICVPG
jgi:hypothetical protein